jgi:hypothetical protein
MSRADKPKVSSEGRRQFIIIASDRARALHAYLRQHCVLCDPPDPSSTGVDVIELNKGMNVTTVQALLDVWV